MTPQEFWFRLAPLVAPLPEGEQAAAVELAVSAVADQVSDPGRDQEQIDEATLAKVREELHQRFYVPLS
jgi:hypothetical protein